MIRMKNGLMCVSCVILTVILMMVAFGQRAQAQGTAEFEMRDLTDSASYAIGMNYVTGTLAPVIEKLRSQGMSLNPEMIAAAVGDMLVEGRSTAMTDSVAQMTLVEFQKLHVDAIAQSLLLLGEKYLEENAAKEGVVTTKSGLQYTVIRPGNGPSPDANDSVRVRYRGYLIDGTVFDERMDSTGITFRLDGVIAGWVEGLQLMREGAQYRLFVPSRLAYGKRSVGEKIRPNETLIFDVELLEVTPVKD